MGNGKSTPKSEKPEFDVTKNVRYPDSVDKEDESWGSLESSDGEIAPPKILEIPKAPQRMSQNNFKTLLTSGKLVVIYGGIAWFDDNKIEPVKIDELTRKQLDIITDLFPTRISARKLFWKLPRFDLESESQIDFTATLPKEILRVIFMYLDPASYSSAVSVCRRWKELESDEVLTDVVFY